MKILFVMRHPAAVRSLGSVLRLLDERGHEVHLAFRRIKTSDSHRELQRLADESQGLTFGGVPSRGGRNVPTLAAGWSLLAEQLRHDVDFLRYLDPIYADSFGLRERAEVKARPSVRALAGVAKLGGVRGVHLLRRALDALESCIPPPPRVEQFVADRRPDVVLVTHLAEFGSEQTDFVRAARRLGLHTGYPVFSWDNLTNKGLIHDPPELVLVWNELQAEEAVELQDVPRNQVAVTGSPSYDHWFDWHPSRSREELLHDVGLPADGPMILYVCSSAFIARNEVAFVQRWVAALRARGGVLGEVGVIVRPHPRNAAQWVDVVFEDRRAVVWPRFGEEPLASASRSNYFDSIHHSSAVVGINTSAQIESAIVGRPVHTVLAEEFRDTQQGTLHFRHLNAEEFGHLYVGRTMDEHLAQLEESLRGRDADADGRNERFLLRFVRPFGLDVPATPKVVETIEELAARPAPAPAGEPALAPLVRLALRPKAARLGRRDRALRNKSVEPLDELRRTARRLGTEETEAPVVAGPWLGDELGELLYWIPFLRWAQLATFELRDRLVAVARPSSTVWYQGIGRKVLSVVHLDEIEEILGKDLRFLPASLVEECRGELADRHPSERFLRRMLDFEAPEIEAPDDAELPADFVAVDRASLTDALDDVAVMLPEDRAAELEVFHRARAFVGGFGPSAILAATLGLPTVAIDAGGAAPDDRRLAESFFPRLQVVATEEEAFAAAEGLGHRTTDAVA
jgi:hypothetical protein